MASSSMPGEPRLALTAGIGCYLIWGFVPLVFQAMGRLGISPWEILANRTIWAVPTALVFVLAAGQLPQVVAAFRQPRVVGWLAFSTLLIAVNWMTFIWAVNSGRVLETSLGYYLNPLLSMAVGALVFRERIDRIGAVSIAFAVVGVAIQTAAIGHLPIVSLTVALTFGGYAIVRKQVAAEAQTGLLMECLMLAVPGLVFVLWLQATGAGHLGASLPATAWLVASGPITAGPLLLFSWAARRMSFSVMGFLQFITPSMTFCLGLLQGEPLTHARAISFAFIWVGVALFAYGAWRRARIMTATIAEVAG